MNNNYTIITINPIKASLSYMLFFVVVLSFTGFSAYYAQSPLIAFLTLLIFFIIWFFLLRKRMLYLKRYTIEKKSTGFLINSKKLIKWSEIVWYRYDDNGYLVDNITFKLISGEVYRISYYKKCGFDVDWCDFKKYFFEMVNSQNVSNFYLSNKWNIVIYILVSGYILIPILMYFLKLPLKSTIAPFLIYFGSTSTLIATIYANRKK